MPQYPPNFPSFDIIPADRRPAIAGVLERLMPMYARDTGGLSDDEQNAWLDRRRSLTRLLAELPTDDPAHLRAKIAILCHRLRIDLPDTPEELTTYLLAESVRGDVENAHLQSSRKG